METHQLRRRTRLSIAHLTSTARGSRQRREGSRYFLEMHRQRPSTGTARKTIERSATGVGLGEIVSDQEIMSRSDCVLVARSANERWPMSDDHRAATIKRLVFIVLNEGSNEPERIAAAKAIAAFDKINLDQKPKVSQRVNLNLNVSERKEELRKRIESLTIDADD